LMYRGQILKPRSFKGYLRLTLRCGPISRCVFVHRLVLEAFVGPMPPGAVSRHLNGDPTDNRIENLAYGSQSENQLDAIRHGTHSQASKTRCKQGHEYTAENTYLAISSGQRARRRCRRCVLDSNEAGRQRRRASC
jgi:hypothetical protein